MSKSETDDNLGPLSGIKVVDLTRYAAGPTCTMILADMGAEIIKVEEPGMGDAMRTNPPLVEDIGGSFPYFNRNKKSITLNLREDKGKEILRRLIQWGDVLVENYRPGFMQRVGFDYPAVRKINPRVIMVSISAYGQTGLYNRRAGFDWVAQAMGGIMSLTGTVGSPPLRTGTAIADLTTGIFGALGAVLALYHRRSTGLGQHVESTLTDSIVFFVGMNLVSYVRGDVIERGVFRAPAGTFQANDGSYIVIMAQDDNHWPHMARIIGRQDLAAAPGYTTRAERAEHAEELCSLMEAWVSSHTIGEVEAALDEAGLPFGRVQTLAEVLEDANLNIRGLFKKIDHYGEALPLFGPYPILSDTPGSLRTPCPRLGQHNEEIYCGLLGFSPEELATLKSEGVV